MRRLLLAAMLPASVALGQGGGDAYKAGRAALTDGKADAAVSAFEKAVAAEPARAEYHLWLARAIGTVAINANALRQPFLAKRAKAEFEKTVLLDPSNVGGREGMMQFYLFAPGILGGSDAKARGEADAIATLNAMRGHLARATIAQHDKDAAAQEREIRAAFSEFPDSVNAMASLAGFLLSTNKLDDAGATVERFVGKHPADLTGMFWTGRVAAASGKQLEQGERALRAVLASPALGTEGAPNAAQTHFRLGELLARKGAKAEAKTEFEAALRINPRLAGAKRALADLKS